MMSTRRSLFTFGALVVAVALLAPATALAQTDVRIVAAEPASFEKLTVNWTASTTGGVTGYRVYVRKGVALTNSDSSSNATKYVDVDGITTATATVSGLTHSTMYFAAVATISDDVIGDHVASGDPGASASTTMAPPPAPPGGVMAEGGDETFMVSWTAPYAGASGITIDHYRVQKREVAGSLFGDWVPDEDDDDNDKMGGLKVDGDMTSVMFEDLENGVTYQARVMAMNSADVPGEWSIPDGHQPAPGPESAMVGDEDDMDDDDDEEEPMETPALPIAGLLALGAGLLAAGRRRLRL